MALVKDNASQESLLAQYPVRDMEVWLDLPEGESAMMAFAQLAIMYEVVDEAIASSTATLDLPCSRGCDACCRNSVFLTPLEFAYAWAWAQENLTDAIRQEIIDKGLSLYRQHQTLIDAFDEPPPEGERDHFSIAKELHFACPLLGDDGACQIYPARELLSRLFGTSFNADGGMYGCHLIHAHMEGKEAALLTAQDVAKQLQQLPQTHKRQVYPYYLHQLYGAIADNGSA